MQTTTATIPTWAELCTHAPVLPQIKGLARAYHRDGQTDIRAWGNIKRLFSGCVVTRPDAPKWWEDGKLLLAAKVGELCPPMSRQEAGAQKGKKGIGGQPTPFYPDTLTDYRKLAKHQQEEKIDDYWRAAVDAGHDADGEGGGAVPERERRAGKNPHTRGAGFSPQHPHRLPQAGQAPAGAEDRPLTAALPHN
ncbi:MAG: hypothetical protein ACYSWU_05175 [Planctomycetota bacterium]